MRIFLSCLQSTRKHPVPAYQYWEGYFKHGIQEGGHQWLEAAGVDWAEALVYNTRQDAAAWRERTWDSVVKQVRTAHQNAGVDLFLAYLYPKMVDPGAIADIQRLGIPVVNFFCDNVREFVHVPDEFRAFDLNWVPELQAVRMYAHDGVPHIHAAMATWIPPEQRTHAHEEQFGVSFIGSRDTVRERLLADAIALGLEPDLRGAGWPIAGSTGSHSVKSGRSHLGSMAVNQLRFLQRYGVTGLSRKIAERFQSGVPDDLFAPFVRPRPDQEQYVHITQGSRITLGVNRYPSYRFPLARPGTYSRGRDIEAPMMGACYLTEWTEELEEMYDIGSDIETYRTAEELVEKVNLLTRDTERRKAMRRNAQRRALTSHSVPRTIERIAEAVGIGVGSRGTPPRPGPALVR